MIIPLDETQLCLYIIGPNALITAYADPEALNNIPVSLDNFINR
jgi:hypothetical protein